MAAAATPGAADVGRFRVARFDFAGVECLAAGTGYTGEDGIEIAVPADKSAQMWRELVEKGATPAGLGARDTLRLEAGLPLHGHELGPGITPLQANLAWVVGWDKGDFRGREPLEAERARGPARLLKGLLTEGRRPPRTGDVVRVAGVARGAVTSGNFSPVLGRGIALGFLPPATPEGALAEIDIRNSGVAAEVVRPPFYKLVPPASSGSGESAAADATMRLGGM